MSDQPNFVSEKDKMRLLVENDSELISTGAPALMPARDTVTLVEPASDETGTFEESVRQRANWIVLPDQLLS